MAEYAVLIYASPDEPDTAPSPELVEPHIRHAEELRSSGVMVAAVALQSIETATSLRGDTITDGPFLETKEVLVGLYTIEAQDLDAALALARRNPILEHGGGLEVRPVRL